MPREPGHRECTLTRRGPQAPRRNCRWWSGANEAFHRPWLACAGRGGCGDEAARSLACRLPMCETALLVFILLTCACLYH